MRQSKEEPILIISPFPLYPPRSGASKRVLGLATFMGRRGLNVTILCVSGFLLKQTRRPVAVAQNVKYLERPVLHPSVIRHLLHANIIQFEFPFLPHLMLLAKMIRKRVILDEHGVELKFWDDMSKISRFARRPPDSLRRAALRAFRSRTVIYLMEKISIDLADKVFTVNELDSQALVDLYRTDPRKLNVIPTCVQTQSPESEVEANLPAKYVIFVGSFAHPPNLYGARITIEQIIPIVQRSIDIPFLFVGTEPPVWLRRCADSSKTLVTGDVRNIDPYIIGASLAICPIWHGSGSRVKILDYMRCGKAIVSTHKGAEGLAVTDGENIILRDTVQDFSEAITWLLKHPDLAASLGDAAKLLVSSRYSWEQYEGSLRSAYGI